MAKSDDIEKLPLAKSWPKLPRPAGGSPSRRTLRPRSGRREAALGTACQVASIKRVRSALRPGEGQVRCSPRTQSVVPGGPQAPAHLRAPRSSLRSSLFSFQRAARLAGEVKVCSHANVCCHSAAPQVASPLQRPRLRDLGAW